MKLQHTLKIFVAGIALVFGGALATSAAQAEEGPFIVILGTPAAGKASNSEMISRAHSIPWVNIREELLEEVSKEAKKGSSAHAFSGSKRGAASLKRRQSMKAAIAKLEAGELVSDDSLNALVATELLSSNAAGGFILDGYPMTVAQAEFLDSLLELRGVSPLKLIYLSIPDEVSQQRMKERGRADDKGKIGAERLRIFHSMVGPLLDYYGEDAVDEIDATQSNAAVAREIAKVLEE
jgi:adenylate kinase